MTKFLLPFLLVLTNGPTANITAPADPLVGWQFVADNGPYTACGPRLFCSVQHVGVREPVFHGELYHIDRLVEPPGSDIRFLVVDHDVPMFAPIYQHTVNSSNQLNHVWLVGGGVGTGAVVGGTNFFWGGQESKRLRWSSSGLAFLVPEGAYYVWRTDQAGSADGDSGYAAFTVDGKYIGPIQFGDNPVVPGQFQSGGILAWSYISWITNQPPPMPKTPSSPSISRINP